MQHKSILMNSKKSSLFTNRLECSVCKQQFWMTSKYLDHVSTHKHLLLSCNICNTSFYDQKHLDEHYLSHNEIINTYDCSKCAKKFLQKFQLVEHMKFHLMSSASSQARIKKKKVRFSNILQSKGISDKEFASEEEFAGNFKDITKITTTRSGRVVKAKRVFENKEPELKSKRLKKSPVMSDNTSLTCKNETTMIDRDLLSEVDVISDTNKLNECISSKTLCIVAEKIPDVLLKKCSERQSIFVPEILEKNPINVNSNQSKVNSPKKSPLKKGNMTHFKTVSQNSKSSIIKTGLQEEKKIVTTSSVHNLIQAYSSIPTVTKTSPIKPFVDQQFIYVGPKQHMGKIKTIIEEVESMSRMKGNQCNSESSTSNIVKSSTETKVCESNPSSAFSNDKYTNSPKSENLLNANSSILDKKVVNNFLVVKVTPELMKEMQEKTSQRMTQKSLSSETSDASKETEISLNCPNKSGVPSSVSPNISISSRNQKKDEEEGTVKLCDDIKLTSKQNERLPVETLRETSVNAITINESDLPSKVDNVCNTNVSDECSSSKMCEDTNGPSKQNEKLPVKSCETLKYAAVNATTVCELPSKVDNVSNTNLSDECIPSKTLCVVAEKIPDELLKKCSKKLNTCGPGISENNSTNIKLDHNKVKCSQESLFKKNISHFKSTGMQSCKSSINKTKSRQNNKSVIKAKAHSLNLTPRKITSAKPIMDKQFLYVGPRQKMDKIKSMIEEVKSLSKITAEQFKSMRSSLNVSESSNETNVLKSNPASTKLPNINLADRCLFSNEKNNSPLKSQNNIVNADNGILDQKVVKDFLVVKVTPEFMKEMHEKTILSQKSLVTETSNILEGTVVNLNSPNITCVPLNISPKISTSIKMGKKVVKLCDDKKISSKKNEIIPMKTSETLKGTAINFDSTNESCTPSSISPEISMSIMNQKKDEEKGVKLNNEMEIISGQNENFQIKSFKETAFNINSTDISCAPVSSFKKISIRHQNNEESGEKDTDLMSKQTETLLQSKTSAPNFNVTSHVTEQVAQQIKNNSRVQVSGNNSSCVNSSDDKNSYSVIQTSLKEHHDQQNNSATDKMLHVNSLDDKKTANTHNSDILETDVQTNKIVIVDSNKNVDSNVSNDCNNVATVVSRECPQSSKKLDTYLPAAQPNDTNDPVIKMSNKILELYKAKMEEKERKKKAKYEQKKRQRYRDETLNKKLNHSPSTIRDFKRSKCDDFDGIVGRLSTNVSVDNKEKLDRMYHSHKGQESEAESERENCRKSKTSNKNHDGEHLFYDLPMVTDKTYSVKCPCESNKCSGGHVSSTHTVSLDVQNYNMFKSKADDDKGEDLQTTKFTVRAEEEAIKKAQEICSNIKRTLNDEECLEYLNKLDDLIFSFNISNKCAFVYDIFRFCRVEIKNYDVKYRAISLHQKMLKSLSNS